jgi:hypothetical protein
MAASTISALLYAFGEGECDSGVVSIAAKLKK